MKAKKISGDLANGGFNSTLGMRNPTPSASSPPGKSLKGQGVSKLSTRMPYDSSKGEIRDHKGLQYMPKLKGYKNPKPKPRKVKKVVKPKPKGPVSY